MTARRFTLGVLAAASLGLSPAAAQAEAGAAATETYRDIEATLGIVPTFMKRFPPNILPGAWQTMKTVQLNPSTALSPKDKELIGLAVAAQIPCEFCIYFHTEAAELGGAAEQEISEAIAMAALTRQWSTVLNGTLTDEAEFRAEVSRMFAYAASDAAKKGPTGPVTDAASAYRDMERTLGAVPSFMRAFPEVGVAAAWTAYKALALDPGTALSAKTKELIGLGVAAQIPCHYCAFAHTEAARLNGATDEEIKEAIAMAGITRHWSTVLNGQQTEPQTFTREADKIMRYVSARMAAKTP